MAAKKEIKIKVWMARDTTEMPQTTKVHYCKPELVTGQFKCVRTRSRTWKSKSFIAVENFLKPGELKQVEIIIREC